MNNTTTNSTNGHISETSLESLILKLKEQESLQAKELRRVYILYICIIVFFTGMYILNPDPYLGFYQRLTGAILIFAFSMMAYVLRRYYSLLRKVDYTQSVYQVFKKAAERYRFWETKRMAITAVFIILIDIALSMMFNGRYLPASLTWIEKTLIVQAFYIPILAVSFAIGWLQWRKKKKPVLDRIMESLKELEGEND
jgi:hypothetical protein